MHLGHIHPSALSSLPHVRSSGTLQVNVRMVYGDGTLSPVTKSNTLSYAQPACPAPVPVIDSVRIEPASVTLPSGGTQMFRVQS